MVFNKLDDPRELVDGNQREKSRNKADKKPKSEGELVFYYTIDKGGNTSRTRLH